MRNMSNEEAVQMMKRCKDEIARLREEIAHLRPKAEAYDSITAILRLMPRQSIGMGEDLVWVLDHRIRQLETTDMPDHETVKTPESEENKG